MSYEHFTQQDTGTKSGLYGVYVGIVTDNEDPEDLARVRVRFPWRDASDESRWARIAMPMTGKQMGTYFLPQEGDEVLVAFEDGDIHNPYIVGSLWNGEANPPEKNDGSNDIRKIRSRAGHEIEFDDDDGGITVTTDSGNEIVLDDGSDEVTVADSNGNTITMSNSGVDVKAKKKVSLSGKDINLKAKKGVKIDGKKVSVAGKGKVEVASKGKLKVDAKGKLDLGAKGMMKIQSPSIVTIKGSLIQLN